MAQGISCALPLVIDTSDGAYHLIKNYKDMVRQNLKMLLLTSPGERVWDANYGVGIKRYLFLHNISSVLNDIHTRIMTQCQNFMPFLDIQDIQFFTSDNDPNVDVNAIVIKISYSIIPLGEDDTLTLNEKLS